MANTKKSTVSTKNAKEKSTTKTTDVKKDAVVAETISKPKEPIKARKERVQLPLNTEVDVVNGFHGRLMYKGKKSGDEVEWENFGDSQTMELKELKDARASQRKFFTANWWLIDDPDVVEFLNVGEYYKYAVNAENYDDIFNKPIEELEAIVSELTDGQKKSMAYRAVELINSGELDSRKTIDALRDALGFELIEE